MRIVTMLEKSNKDARFLENWRPISLINVDVKICSKALCNRIKTLLPKLINPNQAAFVTGRSIDEPLRFLIDTFHYAEFERKNEYFVLFAADFQKAFNLTQSNIILYSRF